MYVSLPMLLSSLAKLDHSDPILTLRTLFPCISFLDVELIPSWNVYIIFSITPYHPCPMHYDLSQHGKLVYQIISSFLPVHGHALSVNTTTDSDVHGSRRMEYHVVVLQVHYLQALSLC
jgi:hypothetical protein